MVLIVSIWCQFKMFLTARSPFFSYFDGDDPPDDPQIVLKVPKIEPKEERQEEESGASVKKELPDTDLDYLFQYVVQKPSLDEELKEDLQKKRDNHRYIDMLVR